MPLWEFTRARSYVFTDGHLDATIGTKQFYLIVITIAGFSGKVRLPPSGQPRPRCSRDAVSYPVGFEAALRLFELFLGDEPPRSFSAEPCCACVVM